MDSSLPYGNRRFYDLPSGPELLTKQGSTTPLTSLLPYINESIIGRDKVFIGPFGSQKVVYCDYTASGRSLQFIEDFIQEHVLPVYGNTHTTSTVTSLQTTLFRHEARDVVRNSVNASEHDAVIFTGSGCTGAIHKLISALHLDQPPVVLCGPFEHHSNLLPWRELGSDVINIQESEDGRVDLDHLLHELKTWQNCKRTLIGCFAAASNVTGVLVDVNKITAMLHRYGALSFWDYATAGPYVNIDMNPVVTSEDQAYVYKDAVFISTHKFVGGVQTPGVLVAKKKLFKNPVPSGSGGGSVFFVHKDSHRYLQEAEMREEGGTPAIVESVRAGLVFQLKEAVGSDLIMKREHNLCSKAIAFFKDVKNLVILGPTDVPRLPIFSFMIQHPESGHYLHYNYVCALLNDMFGIQARGGCACAGPYAQDLLGINVDLAHELENLLLEDNRLDRTHLRRYREYSQHEILRPGFVRLNLPYFMDDETVEFILDAVKMVAEHGWKMLPQYNFNPETGEWRHRTHQVFTDRKWIGYVSYKEGVMNYKDPKTTSIGPPPDTFQNCLDAALEHFKNCKKNKVHIGEQSLMFDEKSNELRWFILPSEAYMCLQNPHVAASRNWKRAPFKCAVYPTYHGKHAWTHCPCECATVSTCKVHGNCDCTTVPSCEMHGTAFKKQRIKNCDYTQVNVDNNSVKKSQMGFREVLIKEIQGNYLSTSSKQSEDDLENMNAADEGSVSHNMNCDNKEMRSPITVYLPSKDQSKRESKEHKVGKQKIEDAFKSSRSSSFHGASLEANGIQLPEVPSVILDTPQNKTNLSETEVQIPISSDSDGLTNLKSIEEDCDKSSHSDQIEGTLDFLHMLSLVDEEEGGLNENEAGATVDGTMLKHLNKTEKNVSAVDKCEKAPVNANFQKKSCTNGTCCPVPNGKSESMSGKETNIVKSIWHPPYKHILKLTCEALDEYSMIKTGDRVMVCLSGGKDSLTLLHTLRQYQFVAGQRGIKFDIGAVTIDPQADSYDPSPLKPYLAELGVPYFYEEQCIMEAAKDLPYECASICSYCSRMKRGRIYTAARREGYNVLALGQHLDDLAESFLMSLFFNGITRTMKASYTVAEGDLRVIRPLVYVREKDLRMFAEEKKLPVIPDNCPACFEAPKERHRMKQLLASQEISHPRLFHSLKAALKPIMAINKTGCNVSTILTQINKAHKDSLQPVEDILDKL